MHWEGCSIYTRRRIAAAKDNDQQTCWPFPPICCGNPASRRGGDKYALLETAQDLAVDAGNVPMPCAIQETCERFDIPLWPCLRKRCESSGCARTPGPPSGGGISVSLWTARPPTVNRTPRPRSQRAS